jgi:hypothetical protein
MNPVTILIYDDIHILTRTRKFQRSIKEHGQPRYIAHLGTGDMDNAKEILNRIDWDRRRILDNIRGEEKHRYNIGSALAEGFDNSCRIIYDDKEDIYKGNMIYDRLRDRITDNTHIKYPEPKPYYSNHYQKYPEPESESEPEPE